MTKANSLSMLHSSGSCGGDNYTSLSSLLHEFLEQGCSRSTTTNIDLGSSDERAASLACELREGVSVVAMEDKAIKKLAERIARLLDQGMAGDSFRVRLASAVAKAAADMASLRFRISRSEFRRAVVSRLREAGYDAAICQTRWPGTRDVSAGNYEYIDVVSKITGKAAAATLGERYIVDLGFKTEFVVARPMPGYSSVLEALPSVLVARPRVAQQVVKVAGKAARRSLKSQGLTVPPWRKKRFMAAKWFGPRCRTADTATGHHAPVIASVDAMCRTVGFVPRSLAQPPCLSYAL